MLTREEEIFFREHDDQCTLCGRKFKKGETIAIGYSIQGVLHVVCQDCIRIISPRGKYMHTPRPYKIPNPDDMLWRFMDLAKFISLLKERALYLTRVDQFNDPFECAIGQIEQKPKYDAYYLNFCKYAIATSPREEGQEAPSEDYIQKQAERLFKELSEANQRHRYSIFVNCWHKNSVESEAMWNLYVKDMSQGVAIQTTYERLYNALNKEPSLAIGEVNYVDYSKGTIYMNDVHWYKRKSFEHEREVRVVRFNPRAQHDCYGVFYPVDLDVLIEKIYVSPLAQTWFVNIVSDVLERYGIKKEIVTSRLNAEAFYG